MRHKILTITPVFLFLFLAPLFSRVHAATYYVSTSGNDNASGSQSTPWKSFSKAVSSTNAGDTVYIRSGTYSEQLKPTKSGNSNNYITFAAYQGETPILDGTNLSFGRGGIIDIRYVSYIKISGLRVIHSKSDGIYLNSAHYITLEKNSTYDTYTSGIGVWHSDNILIDGNDIELACNTGTEESLKVDGSSYIEVKNNVVHDGPASPQGGEGINISGGDPSSEGSHDIKVHHNVVHDLVKLGFGVEAWMNHLYNVEVYNNISYNNMMGYIVGSEQGGMDENVKFYNNIAYNNSRAGFAITWWGGTKDGLKKNIQFINNTSYGNSYGLQIQTAQNEQVLIRNNILTQNNTAIQMVSGAEANVTQDHNLTSGDPRYVNAPAGNFHLQSGSPAIDTGSSTGAPSLDFDGNPRPQGAGYDIGAYEYSSGSTPAPTPTPTPTLTPKPGDANADGKVDGIDYVIWLSHYNQSTSRGYLDGDFNNNGLVDGVDYVIWLNSYGIM